ncbi:MAG TPA: hypothetical protein VMA34_14500 [Terracidiphilus sp.]|nr:hypothetical protein [Terracidiphilus sp.]
MPQGRPAADSFSPVSAGLIETTTNLLGAPPAFWGRYFTSVAAGGGAEFRRAAENQMLNAAGIRVLPVARQTQNVSGSAAQGTADGAANARDFIVTFGLSLLAAQGGNFYIFLDVEGDPSLSTDYYTGWVQGLAAEAQALSSGSVTMLPCLYASQADATTWSALGAAISAGAPCHGAWIARYPAGDGSMIEWSDTVVTPVLPSPFPVPILAWQYAGNCLNGQIDCSQTNPGIDAESQLLKYLVLPPG